MPPHIRKGRICFLVFWVFSGLPALALPSITIVNDSLAQWRVVNAFSSILPLISGTKVRFRTVTREMDGQTHCREHVSVLNEAIPPKGTFTLELLDRLYPGDPSNDGLLFYLQDSEGRYPGLSPQIDYRIDLGEGDGAPTATLSYYSPLQDAMESGGDEVVQITPPSSMKIMADSWEPVVKARKKQPASWLSRLLCLW